MEQLAAVTERLSALGVGRVYLFGSYARGTATRHSDLDLLILWDTDLPPLARIGEVLSTLKDLDLTVEPVVLTPNEFAERRALPFLRSVMQEAKLIYER